MTVSQLRRRGHGKHNPANPILAFSGDHLKKENYTQIPIKDRTCQIRPLSKTRWSIRAVLFCASGLAIRGAPRLVSRRNRHCGNAFFDFRSMSLDTRFNICRRTDKLSSHERRCRVAMVNEGRQRGKWIKSVLLLRISVLADSCPVCWGLVPHS